MCALHKNCLHLIINKYNLPYFFETVENVFQFKCGSKYSTTLVTFHFYSPRDHFLPNRFLQKASTGNQTELLYFGCFDWLIEYKIKPSTIVRTESFCLGLFLSYFLTKSKQLIAKQPGENEPWAEATWFPTFMA